jgi:flavin reductase (DIM6/NTAB) family NADH-FMN oxidoreductase RutF
MNVVKRSTAGAGELPAISPDEFRRVLGNFPTGVTVVSTLDDKGAPYGVTASSFVSLSLEPPLVQWSLKYDSYSYGIFNKATHFAINVLASDQEQVSRNFCKPVDRFATVEVEQGIADLPLIRGSVAWLECEVHDRLPGGDHVIMVGRVLRSRDFAREPLLHWKGRYVRFQ